MAIAKSGLSLLLATSLCVGAMLGCVPGGQGDPCIPEDEYQTTFPGYDEDEVNIESRSFQCETRVCLVNHFRGRVSCPYGQSDDALGELPGQAAERCHIPGTTGERQEDGVFVDAVSVPVRAQLVKRQASKAVYCSCRCANEHGKDDDGAEYCKCNSGFKCTQLIGNLNLGSAQLVGAYCIRSGTAFENTAGPESCSRTALNCGEEQPY